jgi:hypothetical protein
MRGVGKVVDDERRNEPRDEPVRRGVVDDERRNEPRDEPVRRGVVDDE